MAKSEWIGKTLSNRYVIEEMLGQGGMSAVYKATDPNLRRVVAIKVIHTHLSSNPDFVRRFEQEAAAVAQLRHPGIVQVYDFNKDDDVYYMVLEFVPGETLQDHLKRLNENGRRLSVAKVVEYMANICDAVDYAHQRGMIHRDIKPANLMLTTTGQVILMDFGIAKIVGGTQHTATGAVVGTAMYMSPEQIKGEQPDRRTDVYSLGVTLFEMASGRPPFEADSAMTLMMMHVNDPVPDIKKINPDVHEGLAAIINKALEKEPDNRYQTAAQMAVALRNSLGAAYTRKMPAQKATMMEEVPSIPQGGTVVEQPAAGTYVERAPAPAPSKGTLVETPPPPPPSSVYTPPTVQPPAPKPKTGLALPVIAAIIIGLLCLGGGGVFLASRLMGAAPTPTEPVVLIPTDTQPAPATEIASAPTIALTDTPSVTDTPSSTPTATVPPGIPYARINSITIDGDHYVIDFETFEYTPQLPGMHVHFFYNTVSPENAGSPGSGPWDLYGGPSPYTKFIVAKRPPGATQMCALVANSNHSIQLNSGNCLDLP